MLLWSDSSFIFFDHFIDGCKLAFFRLQTVSSLDIQMGLAAAGNLVFDPPDASFEILLSGDKGNRPHFTQGRQFLHLPEDRVPAEQRMMLGVVCEFVENFSIFGKRFYKIFGRRKTFVQCGTIE